MGNIVWLAAYPKSGNTWLRAFIYNLIEQPAKPGRIAVLPDYFESESDPRWYLPLLGGKSLEDCNGEEIISLKSTVHRQIAASRQPRTVSSPFRHTTTMEPARERAAGGLYQRGTCH